MKQSKDPQERCSNVINPEDLIQKILKIMEAQINKLAALEELTDQQLKLLPDILRIVLSCHKDKRTEDKKEEQNIALLGSEQLMAEYEKERAAKEKAAK